MLNDRAVGRRGRSRREILGLIAGAAGATLGAPLGALALARPAAADPDSAGVSTMALTATGLDYSWGRPRPSAIAAAGYDFICRYHSYTSSKNLSRAEADAARSAGLNIVSVWENAAGDALSGRALGVTHATEAARQATACGMPAGRPIYFAVDFDATAAQQAAINAYFDGVASVIGRARTGAYAGYDVIKRLFDAGKITYGWQTYAWSEGRWDTRAQLRQVQNGVTFDGADVDRDEAHAADYGGWTGGRPQGTANVYGVLADGRLTYSPIDIGTGDRLATRISTATLGFTPVAMATLNFNTILLTDTAGKLYRVDVITNSNSLVYNAPVAIAASGWTHDLLAFDGNGHLFGIANGSLRRYTLTAAKPAAANITQNTLIDAGFTLNTLTTVGPNRIMGTTSAGALRSYLINGPGDWVGATLRASTWTFTHMLSPGAGIYLARNSGGGLIRCYDANPFDGNGSDISNLGAVDDSGWTQTHLSAQPETI